MMGTRLRLQPLDSVPAVGRLQPCLLLLLLLMQLVRVLQLPVYMSRLPALPLARLHCSSLSLLCQSSQILPPSTREWSCCLSPCSPSMMETVTMMLMRKRRIVIVPVLL